MRSILIIAFLSLFFIACKKDLVSNSQFSQPAIFQSDYLNYAWGYNHQGWLVDSSGSVWTYSMPQNWVFPDSTGIISFSGMNTDLQQINAALIKINKDTLKYYFDRLQAAKNAEITLPKMVMADAGSSLYSGYFFNSTLMQYQQIIIRQEGDVFIENKSSQAAEIYFWMIRVNNLVRTALSAHD